MLPFRSHRSRDITPRDLFKIYSDGFWLDASVGTCTDFVGTGSAGTTPTTTDATTILSWNDQSGRGRHWSIAANGPTLKNTIVNSRPVIRFDGTNDELAGGTLVGFGTAAEIFYVTKASADNIGFTKIGTHDASQEHYPFGGVVYSGFASNARKTTVDPVQNITIFHLANFISTASEFSYNANGVVEYTTGSNFVDFTATPNIGKSSAGMYFNGDMAEIVCFNAKLKYEERKSLKQYFANKYRLPIT